MLATLKRFFGLGEAVAESGSEGIAIKKATRLRLERSCARAHINQEQNPTARLPKFETQPMSEVPVDTSAPIIETESNSPANVWLEMRRTQGLEVRDS